MERESQEQYLKRKLAEGKARLQEMKDNKEAFDCSLEMVNWLLNDLEETGWPGPDECEEAYKEISRVLEWLHGYIKGALDLAVPFTTPGGEAELRQALDKTGNLRIQIWQLQRTAGQKAYTARRANGIPQCPAQVAAGITDTLSERAAEFCLHECEYQDRCVLPIPKR